MEVDQTGDISYRDGRSAGATNEPYLVIGAEKHDAGGAYPSFNGYVDEVRISNTVRYTGNFTRPSGAFGTDGNTVGLYHFNEGSGTSVGDSSGVGPNKGYDLLWWFSCWTVGLRMFRFRW